MVVPFLVHLRLVYLKNLLVVVLKEFTHRENVKKAFSNSKVFNISSFPKNNELRIRVCGGISFFGKT
jgi:hypothetical protein